MDCLFCKIIDREIPADIVYEDESYLAFKDINPKAKTHLLIIPKKHFERFDKINNNEDVKITSWLFEIAHKIIKDQNLNGCRLQMNCWKEHGQEVFHVHLHLMSDFNI